jgi:two-component system cell cycle sensor histidine kinase/response regulator CckA
MAQQLDSRRCRQFEAIGKLSPEVAHDINNLLSGILGYSQILLMDPANEYLRPQVEEIEKAGKRIASLAKILQVFRHKSTYRAEVLNVNHVIQELGKYFPLILGPRIEFCFIKDPALWPVNADLAYIRQALIVLAVDMLDVLPQGGSVTLETRNLPAVSASGQGKADDLKHSVLVILSAAGTVLSDKAFEASLERDLSKPDTSMDTISDAATAAEIIRFCCGQVSLAKREEHNMTIHISLPAYPDDSAV